MIYYIRITLIPMEIKKKTRTYLHIWLNIIIIALHTMNVIKT